MILFYCQYENNISYLINKVIINKNNNKGINNQKDNKNNININVAGNMKKRKKKKKKSIKLKNNISKVSKEVLKDGSKPKKTKKIRNLKNKKLSPKEGQSEINILNTDNNCTNLKNPQKLNIIKSLNDEELNNLIYEEALKIDRRTLFEYYWSLLKKKHIILFTYLPTNDYNLVHIKVCLFFVSLSIYFNVNTLFFDDKTMNKIYEDKGEFNFIFQAVKIFYSTLISSIINLIIKILALSEKNILELKKAKDEEEIEKKIEETKTKLKIKFNMFFIISFLFLLIFWYYLSVFCAVYKNTQIILIKNIIISFCSTLIYPFILNAFPSLLRKFSLTKKRNSNLYKLSVIMAII